MPSFVCAVRDKVALLVQGCFMTRGKGWLNATAFRDEIEGVPRPLCLGDLCDPAHAQGGNKRSVFPTSAITYNV